MYIHYFPLRGQRGTEVGNNNKNLFIPTSIHRYLIGNWNFTPKLLEIQYTVTVSRTKTFSKSTTHEKD